MTFSRVTQSPTNVLAYVQQSTPGSPPALRLHVGPFVTDLPREDAVALAQYVLDKFPLDSNEVPDEETSD